MQDKIQSNFPMEFQEVCISYVKLLIPTSVCRFVYISPHMHQMGFVPNNQKVSENEKRYREKYWQYDLMNPSNFENTNITVICSNMLMSKEEWINASYYQEFFKGIDDALYNADIFFRCNGEIIAILSLSRKSDMHAFSLDEIESLGKLRPLLEYIFNVLYHSPRFDERKYLKEKYQMTRRELDILEFAMSGYSSEAIAKQMKMSKPTVRTHLTYIYEKVDVHSMHELVARMFRELQSMQ